MGAKPHSTVRSGAFPVAGIVRDTVHLTFFPPSVTPLGSTATRAMFSHACQPQRQQHLMCQMVLAAAAPAAPSAAAAAAATVIGLLPLLLVVVGLHH